MTKRQLKIKNDLISSIQDWVEKSNIGFHMKAGMKENFCFFIEDCSETNLLFWPDGINKMVVFGNKFKSFSPKIIYLVALFFQTLFDNK